MLDTPIATPEAPPRPMHVVIIEDDTQTRERIALLIKQQLAGAQITQFDRLATAKAFASANKQDYWLVDLGMPDGSGIDLIAHIRSQDPQALILVISVFGDVDNILASVQMGANGYLLKDAIDKDLVQAIKALGTGGTPLSPMIASRLLECMMPATQLPPDSEQKAVLTGREIELLGLLARGYKYNEAAQLLGVALSTVQTMVRRIYSKLAVGSRSEAIFEAQQKGLL